MAKSDLDLIAKHTPECLKQRPQWVVWKYVPREGKDTKFPINPHTGGGADTTNASTWTAFEQALDICRRSSELAGIGFVFTADDPFCGLDLDNCLVAGEIKPWAKDIIQRLASYSEISPSGNGVKVFFQATKPGKRCRTRYRDGEIEIYDQARFFTVTGQRLPNTPADVEERQEQLEAIYYQVFGTKNGDNLSPALVTKIEHAWNNDHPSNDGQALKNGHASNNAQVVLDDDEIIRLASNQKNTGAKFATLYNGDWNAYFNSQSDAEGSVLCTLAFYTKDPIQLDRLYRQSKLMRAKWDEKRGEKTYGQLTIDFALKTVKRQYKGKTRKVRPRARLFVLQLQAWWVLVDQETNAQALQNIGLTGPNNNGYESLTDDALLHGHPVALLSDRYQEDPCQGFQLGTRLCKQAAEVRLVTVPEHYHTVVDWIEDRDSLSAEELCEQLRATIEAAPMFTPPTKDQEESATNDGVGLVPLGEIDPESGRLVLSPKRTLPTAEAFVREFYRHPEGRTLLNYAGMFLAWQYNHYREVEDESLRQRLQPWLHDALRYIYNPRTKVSTLTNFDSNPGTVKAALDSLRTYVHIPALLTPPAWLDNQAGRPLPQDILPCRSALWHLPTLTTLPSTPKLFVTHALGCDYDPKAVEPTGWLAFLNQVFPGDAEAIALLQTWFGYSLTTDTSLQKMLLLVGAKRSGKGTIARVLTRLLGTDNVCGPTISSLASQFGLQPLLGKSLAIVSDARFTGDNVATVVERLLCISGEDTLTVDRKFQTSVTMKLSTRFMFLTNELPKMSETSGALANRFLILRFTQSFLGKEDPDLTNKLVLELPGILRWAVAGWHKLRAQGRFATSESSKEGVEQLEEICSPVATFVRDCCHTGLAYKCDLRDLYEAWKTWCQDNGRDYPGSVQTFGRDLSAAVPTARTRRNQVTGRFVEGVGLVNPPPKTSESKDKGDS